MPLTVMLTVELTTIGLTLVPAKALFRPAFWNVIVNGPPLAPVTDTLPVRSGMVFKFASTVAGVGATLGVNVRAAVAGMPAYDSVNAPPEMPPIVAVWTSLMFWGVARFG